jgi:hypothetical protein
LHDTDRVILSWLATGIISSDKCIFLCWCSSPFKIAYIKHKVQYNRRNTLIILSEHVRGFHPESQSPCGHCPFSLLLYFLITVCDKGSFGEGCRSICHCLNKARCNNVNGQCPHGDCDSGWKPRTCSESIIKVFLLLYGSRNAGSVKMLILYDYFVSF